MLRRCVVRAVSSSLTSESLQGVGGQLTRRLLSFVVRVLFDLVSLS